MMAATLANGGKNPITKKVVVDSRHVPKVLAVMATAGLYDDSGIWLYNVGLPAKSGVGGGIIAVAPGQLGIAAFSPRLDAAGNSVRAQRAIEAALSGRSLAWHAAFSRQRTSCCIADQFPQKAEDCCDVQMGPECRCRVG